MKKPWKILNGSALKWIAIAAMFLDHIGASLIEIYTMDYFGNSPYKGFDNLPYNQAEILYDLDLILRITGRIAFPIFCFLLIEGFKHTHDVKKYALRLGIFCILSEIPFDLAFRVQPFFWQYQNVFFTLLIGLLTVWGVDRCLKKGMPWQLAAVVILVLGAAAAELLHTDYGAFGVVVIAAFYFGYDRPVLRTVAAALLLIFYGGLEVFGVLGLIPICLYNGERGRQPRYFFYAFYPIHLLIFALIGMYVLPRVM